MPNKAEQHLLGTCADCFRA